MSDGYHVREYGEKNWDWLTVSAWWAAHCSERQLIEKLLPPIGVMVERSGEPVAALWCHLSINVGVAFLENPVSRPGLSLLETAAAMSVALGAMESICRKHDYSLLIANTLPAIGRFLERRHGFTHGGDRVQMIKLLT